MERSEELRAEILRRALKFCEELGLDLVDLAVHVHNRTWQIQVLADLPAGGISIEACSELNHRLDKVLFEDLSLGNDYTLEVSSPGLDRPLKNAADLRRSIGRMVQVFLRTAVAEKREWTGKLLAVSHAEIIVLTKKGEVIIPIDHIEQGKNVIA